MMKNIAVQTGIGLDKKKKKKKKKCPSRILAAEFGKVAGGIGLNVNADKCSCFVIKIEQSSPCDELLKFVVGKRYLF